MSVSVRIFGSENGADFKDSIEISAKGHLFVELWALSHTGVLAEVFEGKNIGTALGCTSNHFWRVNFDEFLVHHELSVESADSGLNLENGLIGWDSQIDDSVVQSDVLVDDGTLLLSVFGLLLVRGATVHFGGLVVDDSACILNLERKDWSRLVDHPEFLDLELNLLRAGLYCFLWDSHLGFDLDDGLSWNLRGIRDHTLRNDFINRKHSLNC